MRVLLRTASMVLLASVSMACASLHARALPPMPPLDVPAPPAPIDAPLPPEPEPPAAQTSPPPMMGAPSSRRTPPTNFAKPPAVRKPDSPEKTEPVPPAAPAKPATEAAPPPASLQTTANVDALEQKIRALLARAKGDLGRIDVRTLGTAPRAQYDEAKRFAEQAEDALKVKNLAFAEQLADKAATLASLLLKR